MNALNRDDLLYLAGLIDGDGNCTICSSIWLCFSVSNSMHCSDHTTQKFLVYIQKLIAYGTVRDRGDISDYVLTETRCVYSFLNFSISSPEEKTSRPYSPNNWTITFFEKFLCSFTFIVDQVSELNDSKNRKITAEVIANELRELKII